MTIPVDQKQIDELVKKWLDGGCSSWGVPEQQIRKLLDTIEAQASFIDEAVGVLERARTEMHKSWCGNDGCCGPCCEISDSIRSLSEGGE